MELRALLWKNKLNINPWFRIIILSSKSSSFKRLEKLPSNRQNLESDQSNYQIV